jgi:hypothetical protein
VQTGGEPVRHRHQVLSVRAATVRPIELPGAYEGVSRRLRGNDGAIRPVVCACCARRGTIRFVVGEDAGKPHELTCPGGFRAGSQGGLPDTFGEATVARPCAGLVTFLAG